MEVFDDMDSLTRSELGLSSQHEGSDFYLGLLRQAEQVRLLQKQVKAHGMDHGLDKPGSKEPGTTVSTDGNFSRAQVLVLPGQSVSTPAKKQPTDRLLKAMNLK
jgi:hypothetical protein|tara:strand:- start:317 stop:628 length:312 start_codon:yes stop_codon:yes gene_type:complete